MDKPQDELGQIFAEFDEKYSGKVLPDGPAMAREIIQKCIDRGILAPGLTLGRDRRNG